MAVPVANRTVGKITFLVLALPPATCIGSLPACTARVVRLCLPWNETACVRGVLQAIEPVAWAPSDGLREETRDKALERTLPFTAQRGSDVMANLGHYTVPKCAARVKGTASGGQHQNPVLGRRFELIKDPVVTPHPGTPAGARGKLAPREDATTMTSLPPELGSARRFSASRSSQPRRRPQPSARSFGATPPMLPPVLSLPAAAALPPIPGTYLGLFIAMVLSVLAFQAMGATLTEAVVVIEALFAAVTVLWKQR